MKRCISVLTLLTALCISTTTLAQPRPATDPRVIRYLNTIENKAKMVRTYQATLVYDQIQGLTGDEQKRFGKVYYLHGKPVQFAVRFTSLVSNGQMQRRNSQWIFDGHWLVEKNYSKKLFIKRQISDPAAPVDPLSIEKSKFPIPLRPNKDEVLSKFAVQIGEKLREDPPNTVRLKLTPHKGSGIKMSLLELWYDQNTWLPVMARTINDESGDELVYQLKNPAINQQIPASEFDTRTPAKGTGWDIQIKPWH